MQFSRALCELKIGIKRLNLTRHHQSATSESPLTKTDCNSLTGSSSTPLPALFFPMVGSKLPGRLFISFRKQEQQHQRLKPELNVEAI